MAASPIACGPAGAVQFEMTPLGALPKSGVAQVRAFGAEAERREYPCIDIGGFIVPGRDPAASNLPGEEHDADAAEGEQCGGGAPPEQAGSAAGSRQRPAPSASPQAAAPGTPAHAVVGRLTTLNLDLPGLAEYHPLARVTASAETVAYFNIPLGLFRGLPIRARLTLEVPLVSRERMAVRSRSLDSPELRAWSVWEGGPLNGTRIATHHQYPDLAMCVCMSGQWIRGVHPLRDYVAFCALWAAKALHERLLGFYPGTQHYPAAVRVRRDQPDEYCGCAARRRYADCCRAADLSRPAYEHWREAYVACQQYLNDLAWQGRTLAPPEELLQLGVATP